MTHVLLWTQMYPKMTPFAPPWSTQKGPNGSKCATKSDMQTIIPQRCQQGRWEGGGGPPLFGVPKLVNFGPFRREHAPDVACCGKKYQNVANNVEKITKK